MKKKIVIILGSMKRGGAERVVSLIANEFVKRGWEVWIGLMIFYEVEYELHEDIHIVDLSGKPRSRLQKLPGWLRDIRKLVNKVQPDEILAFAARMNIITQIATMGMKVSITVSERNDPYMDGRSKAIDWLTDFLYPKAKAVVFQTKRAASYFEKRNLKNSCVIANPISVDVSANHMNQGKIVSVGRLEPQKNQAMLIRAFSQIVDDFPQATLTIYGRGYLENELKNLAKSLGVSSKIQFPGNVLDIHNRISDANVFVLSSDYEGLSNALLEAMMMGLPCISTDCAGADEYIESGKNGILIKTGDEQALVKALRSVLGNQEKAILMGNGAKVTSERFAKECVLEQWYKVITM